MTLSFQTFPNCDVSALLHPNYIFACPRKQRRMKPHWINQWMYMISSNNFVTVAALASVPLLCLCQYWSYHATEAKIHCNISSSCFLFSFWCHNFFQSKDMWRKKLPNMSQEKICYATSWLLDSVVENRSRVQKSMIDTFHNTNPSSTKTLISIEVL